MADSVSTRNPENLDEDLDVVRHCQKLDLDELRYNETDQQYTVGKAVPKRHDVIPTLKRQNAVVNDISVTKRQITPTINHAMPEPKRSVVGDLKPKIEVKKTKRRSKGNVVDKKLKDVKNKKVGHNKKTKHVKKVSHKYVAKKCDKTVSRKHATKECAKKIDF